MRSLALVVLIFFFATTLDRFLFFCYFVFLAFLTHLSLSFFLFSSLYPLLLYLFILFQAPSRCHIASSSGRHFLPLLLLLLHFFTSSFIFSFSFSFSHPIRQSSSSSPILPCSIGLSGIEVSVCRFVAKAISIGTLIGISTDLEL